MNPSSLDPRDVAMFTGYLTEHEHADVAAERRQLEDERAGLAWWQPAPTTREATS